MTFGCQIVLLDKFTPPTKLVCVYQQEAVLSHPFSSKLRTFQGHFKSARISKIGEMRANKLIDDELLIRFHVSDYRAVFRVFRPFIAPISRRDTLAQKHKY